MSVIGLIKLVKSKRGSVLNYLSTEPRSLWIRVCDSVRETLWGGMLAPCWGTHTDEIWTNLVLYYRQMLVTVKGRCCMNSWLW